MYAVIFTSQLSDHSQDYEDAADRMVELCRIQPGFVSVESVRGTDGRGITVCMWESLEDIAAWRHHEEHAEVQRTGRQRWYAEYDITVCEVMDRT